MQRLRASAEFAALIGDRADYRRTRRWIALAARSFPAATAESSVPEALRFGFTVGKQHARRAVDRNTVKRVLREAARAAVPRLEPLAGGARIDVVLRLKAGLPERATVSRATLKRTLRAEADALLAELAQRLGAG